MIFRAGIEAGEFRDLDPRLATFAWLGMHNYTYLWLRANGRLSPHEVASSFSDIFIRGVSDRVPERAGDPAQGAE